MSPLGQAQRAQLEVAAAAIAAVLAMDDVERATAQRRPMPSDDQATCEHPRTDEAPVMGAPGRRICLDCGATLMPIREVA